MNTEQLGKRCDKFLRGLGKDIKYFMVATIDGDDWFMGAHGDHPFIIDHMVLAARDSDPVFNESTNLEFDGNTANGVFGTYTIFEIEDGYSFRFESSYPEVIESFEQIGVWEMEEAKTMANDYNYNVQLEILELFREYGGQNEDSL